jgi:hypothetical protein
VAVPILIFVACFAVGMLAAARWLPSLADEKIGGLAFFVVTGLLAAALSLVGVRIYAIINQLNHVEQAKIIESEIIAAGIRDILWQAGTVFGFACVIYLLAPSPEDADEGQTE